MGLHRGNWAFRDKEKRVMLSKKKKDAIIKKHRTHEHDTGSPQVQIAVLSEEMRELAEHLKTHRQDYSSRRGLLRKVSLRRRLLRYLQREDEKAYEEIVKRLKLKKLPEKSQEFGGFDEEAFAAENEKNVEEAPAEGVTE